METTYKGCFIDAKINELADGSGWTPEVFIAKHDGSDMLDTGYFFKGIYPSREAACEVAIQGAKDLIDRTITLATDN